MGFTFVENRTDLDRDCFVYTAHSELDRLILGSLRRKARRTGSGSSHSPGSPRTYRLNVSALEARGFLAGTPYRSLSRVV